MSPSRIQRKRTAGWKLPPNTVCVDRSTPFGNPYKLSLVKDRHLVVDLFKDFVRSDEEEAQTYRKRIGALRGKNLACWCPLDQPCHADVLLEIANASMSETLADRQERSIQSRKEGLDHEPRQMRLQKDGRPKGG